VITMLVQVSQKIRLVAKLRELAMTVSAKKIAIASVNRPSNMSLLSTFMKWKLRWAVLSGVFSLIVLPIVRLVFKRKPSAKTAAGSRVIDVDAQDVSKNSDKFSR